MKTYYKIFCLLVLSHIIIYNSAAQNGKSMTYTVSNVWIEDSQDSTGVMVKQEGNQAIALFEEGGRLVQVSNHDMGIRSARLDRNLPVLVDVIGGKTSLKSGDYITGNAEPSQITSIVYSLEKGKDKQDILNQKADHYILSIQIDWTYTDKDGTQTSGTSSGKSDLWTVKKLPFSWLPYTLTDGNYQKASVPLSFLHPDVAGFLLNHFEEDLKKLGMLVKARVESVQELSSNNYNVSNRYVKEVIVGNLETNVSQTVDIPELPLISADRYKSIMGWLLISSKFCKQGAGKMNIMATEKQGQVMGQGTAVVMENDQENGSTWIAMGVLGRDNTDAENGCLIISTKPAGPKASVHTITDNSTFGDSSSESQSLAIASYLAVIEGNPVLSVFEKGDFEIREGNDMMRARFRGTGWAFTMGKEEAFIKENIEGQFTLEIEPLKPEMPSIEVPDWVPITFSRSDSQKIAEWTIEGTGVYGAMDAFGKIAAVSIADKPAVKIFDLESLQEIREIVLPMSLGSRNMSLSMAPSGSRLAIGLTGGQLLVVDPRSGETLNEWRYPQSGNAYTEVKPLKFNEKKNYVIGSSKGHTVAWDITTGNPVYEWEESASVNDVDVSPDGSYAVRLGDKDIKVLDLLDGTEVCVIQKGAPAVSVHPNGRKFAIIDYEQTISIYDWNNCNEIISWKADKGWYPSIAWAADGVHLLIEEYGSGNVVIFNGETGDKEGTLRGKEQSRVYTTSHSSAVLSLGSSVILWK